MNCIQDDECASMLARDHVLSENLSTWLGRSLVEARQFAPVITLTEHDRGEWSRFACACYAAGRNDLGHRFSSLAALPSGFRMVPGEFDRAQAVYRAWLVFGWSGVDELKGGCTIDQFQALVGAMVGAGLLCRVGERYFLGDAGLVSVQG